MARVLQTGGCGDLVLLLLLTLYTATQLASAKKTCFMSVRLGTKTSVVEKDFDDYVIRKFLAGCRAAGRTCPGKVLPHFTAKLEGDLAPIRGKATQNLCNIFQREITPSDHGEVYALWHTSSCGKNGSQYLGLLCCWKYTIGSFSFLIPNEGCRQTVKPAVTG